MSECLDLVSFAEAFRAPLATGEAGQTGLVDAIQLSAHPPHAGAATGSPGHAAGTADASLFRAHLGICEVCRRNVVDVMQLIAQLSDRIAAAADAPNRHDR